MIHPKTSKIVVALLSTFHTGVYCCHAREKHVRRVEFLCTGCPVRLVVSQFGRYENVSQRKNEICSLKHSFSRQSSLKIYVRVCT